MASRTTRPARSRRRAGGRRDSSHGSGWVIREVQPKDIDALCALSVHLDSVNLPHDKRSLKSILRRSRESFSGKIEDPFRREYLFVLELDDGSLAGTSMLFAQHGHPETPHSYFDVIPDERYSVTLDRHFRHICLRLGFSYRGPTEAGGLVLDPSLRGRGLGKPLSFVRFLFIAMYRDRFRASVLAELMPPLTDDGRSELWDHLGRKFTDLDYKEADRLSQKNREFIVSLFPQSFVHASLLPAHVQALIGQVGDETKGVRRMLESIGFEYSDRIDPFDGGPHLEAPTDQITLVRNARSCELEAQTVDPATEREDLSRVLIATGTRDGPTRFRATEAWVRLSGDRVQGPEGLAERLHISSGERVWVTPF
jgi:arginine N-succinyltransferase